MGRLGVGQYLELRLLYQAVQDLGGFDEVCREKLWDSVCTALGMATAGTTSSNVKSILRCGIPPMHVDGQPLPRGGIGGCGRGKDVDELLRREVMLALLALS